MKPLLRSRLLVGLVAFVAATATASSRYEAEPVLPTRQLVGSSLPLVGEGYRVEPSTRVESFMGRYRVQTPAGALEAVGVEELERIVAEVPAITQLMAMERSEVFAGAIRRSAGQRVDAVKRIFTQPGETLAALPEGIGQAIRGTGHKVRRVAVDVVDASARQKDRPPHTGEDPEQAASAPDLPDFGRELAGVNRARREIAAKLGMDPYPRTPEVAGKLESLAWAMAAGGLSIQLVQASMPDGLRSVVSTANTVDELAWRLPPADIRRQLEKRLRARGHAPRDARELLRNRAFTPTEQLALVRLIESLDIADGEQDLLALARQIRSPGHARFLIGQLRMLAADSQRTQQVAYATSGGVAWVSLADGSQLLALPLDHLSWTPLIGDGMPESLRPDPRRGRIVLAGSASPMARERLAGLGWLVQERRRPR